jgi:DNA topoisomerase-1
MGLITYMRTDSTHVAASAIAEARDFIKERYGSDFLPSKPRRFIKKAQWAQEAHEAIRPTKIHRQPDQIRPFLTTEQLRLYALIWKRMVASQMSSASYHTTNVEIAANLTKQKGYLLKAASSTLKFPGFMTVYNEGRDEEKQEGFVSLPELEISSKLSYQGVFPEQHFTQPLPRYTEATLIKMLEQKGIGRPSTYAPILSIIQDREYVYKANGKFCPHELGVIVSSILTEHFSKIVDLGFTAQMEKQLDEIAQGKLEWISLLRDFYSPFEDMLHKASINVKKVDMTKPSNENCPICGRPMVVKVGRFGKFLACSGYPDCKTTMPYLVKIGIHCPHCNGELVERVNKKRKTFYGCSNYPNCKFATSYKPIPQSCPDCGKLLVLYRKLWAKCTACGHRVKLSELKEKEQEGATL